VSTDEQEANWTSLQSQKQECLKFASENNLQVPEEYIFLEQYSWAYFDRPQLLHLFSVASRWILDFVLFMKRDRVARDIFVFHQIMKELEKYKVKVFYAKELNSWDTAMDNFMWNTIINFASFEREQIKNRTILWKKTFAINNKRPFWNIPYWYNKNNKTKELEIFEEEKNVVLRIVKNFLDDNLTMWIIAKNLTKDNILPPSFSLKKENEKLIEKEWKKNSIYFWSISNVQRILSRSEMYAWIYQAFSKEYKKIWDKTILLWERPKEEWIQIKVPQIITLKQSKLIKEQLEKNRKYSKKRSVRNYMLQWLLFCDCEKGLLHNFIWYFNNTKELRNYRCCLHNSTKFSKERLCSNHISWLKIEWVVLDTLKELFLNHEYIFEKALEGLNIWNLKDENNRYLDLYGLILEIEEKHKRNEELYIEWMITKDRFAEIKNLLEKKKTDYSDEMGKEYDKLKNSIFREEAKRNLRDIVEEISNYIESFFDNASYDELKELANIVIDKVIVPKDKENPVRIILKIPLNVNDFNEKYYEDELIEYIDDDFRVHVLWKTWNVVPKLLKLSPTKRPLKYRTVEFKDNDDWDNSDLENNERKFLFFLKDKYNQLCKSDHLIKKQKS
jgi:DNA invertase Pin-like site-specific DNA recombinase